MFLQHDKTSTATSAVIALDLKLFHTLPTAWLWHLLTYGSSQLSRNICEGFISHMMMKFKLLWENVFENGGTDSKKRVWCWRHCITLEGHYIEK